MNESELREFGTLYESAWRSLVPEAPFSYQAENCVTSINDGESMVSAEERYAAILTWQQYTEQSKRHIVFSVH